ncbi:PAS domain-containing protein [Kineosporia corallincola]|nr:PAS domain-containing protein [Kineosporia corallincola]
MGMAVVSLGAADPGRFLRVNDALCEFAGVGEGQLVGARVGDFLGDPEHLEQAMGNLAELIAGNVDAVTAERHLFRADGGERWGRVSASAVRPDGDRDPSLILLVEDITARKELTERHEFAILCPGVPDAATAIRIGHEVLAALSREFDLSRTRARVGASIGVAVAADGDTGPDLLHAADQAMYAAKRSGKGAVRLNTR